MIKVSVIIPVYNAEAYLTECLDSVLSQSLYDIEVICINDGSRDHSIRVLKQYAAQDSRVRVIQQNNAGAGAARNRGLAAARGEFISFMDSDDRYASEDVLEYMYTCAVKSHVNAVRGSMEIQGDHANPNPLFPVEKEIDYMDFQNQYGFTLYLFQRDILQKNGIKFPSYCYHEDPVFCAKALFAIKKIYVIPKMVYWYRMSHKEHSFSSAQIYDFLNATGVLFAFCIENNLRQMYADTARNLYCIIFGTLMEKPILCNANNIKVFSNLMRQLYVPWIAKEEQASIPYQRAMQLAKIPTSFVKKFAWQLILAAKKVKRKRMEHLPIKKKIKRLIFNATSDTRDIMEWHFRKLEEQLTGQSKQLAEQNERLTEQDAALCRIGDVAGDTAERIMQLGHLLDEFAARLQESTEQSHRELGTFAGEMKEQLNEILSELGEIAGETTLTKVLVSQRGEQLDSFAQESKYQVQLLRDEVHLHIDYFEHDVFQFFAGLPVDRNPLRTESVHVVTENPVAIHSNDHLYPHGTAHDNTRAPFFIRRCEEIFPADRKLKFLDIGCSGGGLVLDALLKGHFGVGIEGSDYSLRHQRAEWRVLKSNLFTCDATKPFRIVDSDNRSILFDVITAWEVLEHIPEDDVPQLIHNIKAHTAQNGIFIGTVSQVHDVDPVSGADWHVTIHATDWWEEQFEKAGFITCNGLFDPADLARAYGNPPLPWLLDWGIEGSPYIVMRKKN